MNNKFPTLNDESINIFENIEKHLTLKAKELLSKKCFNTILELDHNGEVVNYTGKFGEPDRLVHSSRLASFLNVYVVKSFQLQTVSNREIITNAEFKKFADIINILCDKEIIKYCVLGDPYAVRIPYNGLATKYCLGLNVFSDIDKFDLIKKYAFFVNEREIGIDLSVAFKMLNKER